METRRLSKGLRRRIRAEKAMIRRSFVDPKEIAAHIEAALRRHGVFGKVVLHNNTV
ncbi:MAG: hypothetical protein HY475_03235 [Candidatus Terrybacteria bacterium]|nr:hypothetical protein [Candidatus Terrybacteria bacterium]